MDSSFPADPTRREARKALNASLSAGWLKSVKEKYDELKKNDANTLEEIVHSRLSSDVVPDNSMDEDAQFEKGLAAAYALARKYGYKLAVSERGVGSGFRITSPDGKSFSETGGCFPPEAAA